MPIFAILQREEQDMEGSQSSRPVFGQLADCPWVDSVSRWELMGWKQAVAQLWVASWQVGGFVNGRSISKMRL